MTLQTIDTTFKTEDEIIAYIESKYTEHESVYLLKDSNIKINQNTGEIDDETRMRAGSWHYKGDDTWGEVLPNLAQQIKKVFFYYFDITKSGEMDIKIYEQSLNKPMPQDSKALKGIIEDLASKARKGIGTWVSSFDSVLWNEPCYLCFLMDNDTWKYIYKGSNNISLYFTDGRKGGRVFNANKTFYGAADLPINVDGDNRIALMCANHHLISDGSKKRPNLYPDRYKSEYYKFDLYFKVPIKQYTTKFIPVVIDPTGTNFGPP